MAPLTNIDVFVLMALQVFSVKSTCAMATAKIMEYAPFDLLRDHLANAKTISAARNARLTICALVVLPILQIVSSSARMVASVARMRMNENSALA